MFQLCDNLELFYPAEILKIQTRVTHFSQVRQFWEKQPDQQSTGDINT